MNETKPSQWTARASYGAALLFAIHLVTYFIPAIRDVTTSSSVLGAEALAFIPLTFLVLVPSLVLLPLWFFLVGRLIARGDGLQQSHISLQFEQAPPFDLGKDR